MARTKDQILTSPHYVLRATKDMFILARGDSQLLEFVGVHHNGQGCTTVYLEPARDAEPLLPGRVVSEPSKVKEAT